MLLCQKKPGSRYRAATQGSHENNDTVYTPLAPPQSPVPARAALQNGIVVFLRIALYLSLTHITARKATDFSYIRHLQGNARSSLRE